MLVFFIDNIFVVFSGRVFQPIVDILIITNCTPLSPTCSYIRIKQTLTKNEKELARTFNFTSRYMDNVLSLNTSMFGNYVIHLSNWTWNNSWFSVRCLVDHCFSFCPFLFAIVLSVLQFTASGYLFCIFKLFFLPQIQVGTLIYTYTLAVRVG